MQSVDKKVTIKRTSEDNLKDIQELWNNGEVMKWVGFPTGLKISIAQIKGWFKTIQLRESVYHFVVIHEDEGFCGELFYDVDPKYKRASLDIKFLPKAQGKGIATKALKSLIQHIFDNEREISSVWTEPSPENLKAIGLYTRCGFKEAEPPEYIEPKESYWELKRSDWESNELRPMLSKIS